MNTVFGDDIDLERRRESIFRRVKMGPRYSFYGVDENHRRSFYMVSHTGGRLSLSKKRGVYCYWLNEVPLYVGATNSCMNDRVSYFVGGVWGKSHKTEHHLGAEACVYLNGKGNFKNIYFSYADFVDEDIDVYDIEKILQNELSPIYKKYSKKKVMDGGGLPV